MWRCFRFNYGIKIRSSLTTHKCNNLKTIFEILKKPNLKLTFGNRDLNKIKVGPLTILKTIDNSQNVLVNNFNKGELPLNLSTYLELNKVVGNLEWVQKMSNWYPFWGGINKDNIGHWRDENEPNGIYKDKKLVRSYGFFEKRFLKIFGADTKVGTMSADNLLETIPTELGLFIKDNNDFNAFIVLAVFKSMLLETKLNLPDTFGALIFPKEHLNQSKFRGFLYKMYTDDKNNMIIHKCVCGMLNNNFCECKEGLCNCQENKNMYLFSHGGVSSNIIDKNTIDEISKVLYDDNRSKSLKEKLRDANKVLLTGGYYSLQQKVENKTSKDIEDKINLFNKTKLIRKPIQLMLHDLSLII